MHYYYGPMMDGNDLSWGVFSLLLPLLFFIIIAAVAYRLLNRHEIGNSRETDPIDIAKQRYAKGEITKRQFERLKRDLTQ